MILAAPRDAARLFLELGTVTLVLAVGARLAGDQRGPRSETRLDVEPGRDDPAGRGLRDARDSDESDRRHEHGRHVSKVDREREEEDGEFSIVIAGLAVSSNFGPDLGALAATPVLGTALLGPLATHFADDLVRLLHQGGATTAVQRR